MSNSKHCASEYNELMQCVRPDRLCWSQVQVTQIYHQKVLLG